jgi:hypothetical protein
MTGTSGFLGSNPPLDGVRVRSTGWPFAVLNGEVLTISWRPEAPAATLALASAWLPRALPPADRVETTSACVETPRTRRTLGAGAAASNAGVESATRNVR